VRVVRYQPRRILGPLRWLMPGKSDRAAKRSNIQRDSWGYVLGAAPIVWLGVRNDQAVAPSSDSLHRVPCRNRKPLQFSQGAGGVIYLVNPTLR
jgi:hypothetical protein